jgi:eukaryotic-like serine/threonine-protein kinase
VPATIGRYRVVRRLGSGAFATVWLAEDEALESSVAVKVLADNWAHHPDIRARFDQEARIMRRADSVRLVRVLDIGELPDGRPYLVMPYAAGGTLADRLAVGPIAVPDAVRIAASIARAVEVLHGVGVLHRDLKPSNILFDDATDPDRVLVADLGLAKAIAHASGFTVVAGTPGYMSPEQGVPGGGIDVRADVYAIGALTYHMLTGQVPNQPVGGRSGGGRPGDNGTGAPRPSRLRPGVPAAVDEIVLRAIHRDPKRRWPSAEALATALDAAGATGPGRPSPTRRLRPLRRVLPIAAVLGAVLASTTAAQAATAGWVRVHDASDDLSISVPADWAHQLKDSGWNPAAIRLPAGHAPGLLVGRDLAGWSDPARPVPGVFAGLSRALTGAGAPVPALPAHDGCVRQPDRRVVVAGLAGTVRRWTGCGGTSISYSEAILVRTGADFGVYVQIRQVDEVDRTDRILRSLRVNDPRPLTATVQDAH